MAQSKSDGGIFKYKIAFRVPVVMLVISIFFIYIGVIKVDLWMARDYIGGGYQFQINFNYLLEIITKNINNLINRI